MKKYIVHISDIHYQQNREENQNLVLDAFFVDLREQIKQYQTEDVFIVLSGDIVNAGESKEAFDSAYSYFSAKLDTVGIPVANRICVPGNHDISRAVIKSNFINHKSLISSNLEEDEFNTLINDNDTTQIASKFENYFAFVSKFSSSGICEKMPWVSKIIISKDICIYAVNSAILSIAGLSDNGKPIDDTGKLCINTREFAKVVGEDDYECKILVMHHNKASLSAWGQQWYSRYIRNTFALSLTGHIHDQDIYFNQNHEESFIELNAPQLFSDKHDESGYAIIEIEDSVIRNIKYRQWAIRHAKFVAGVAFSGTDDGVVNNSVVDHAHVQEEDYILSILDNQLRDALKQYPDQEPIWLNRRLGHNQAVSNLERDAQEEVSLQDIIASPRNLCIAAPPQFGLTCLAKYMVKQAYKDFNSIWVYIDLEHQKLHTIEKNIIAAVTDLKRTPEDVRCIVIDSWDSGYKDCNKIIQKVQRTLPDVPIIVMHTTDSAKIHDENKMEQEVLGISECLYLLPLKRNEIRYALTKTVDSQIEDEYVQKITSDLELLNMHRTPLNCYTILVATSTNTDKAIINRTALLDKVLFILFENQELPKYQTKPDVKDCEHVLGRFCEKLIKGNSYVFSKDHFSSFVRGVCEDKLLSVDAESLFAILYENHIIIRHDNSWRFKHSFWIYYFAAKRMLDNSDFAKYIFENKRYIDFPEIIEFYTGTDRHREDALRVLAKDLEESCQNVHEKIGLPESLAPFDSLKWNPNESLLQEVKNQINDDVQASKLPKEVKDRFADMGYNASRPYDQDVHTILHDYYVLILMRDLRAASMALRNSDYCDKDIKRDLFKLITRGWEEVARVIVALSPILAQNGVAGCGGASFILAGNFGNDFQQIIRNVILKIPENLVRWFNNDISSPKIGPLLYNHIDTETTPFRKHMTALMLTHDRPNDWKVNIQQYISTISKNSFYLYDLFTYLNIEYVYGYVSEKDLRDIGFLMKACIAKHEIGIKAPGRGAITKVTGFKLPERQSQE